MRFFLPAFLLRLVIWNRHVLGCFVGGEPAAWSLIRNQGLPCIDHILDNWQMWSISPTGSRAPNAPASRASSAKLRRAQACRARCCPVGSSTGVLLGAGPKKKKHVCIMCIYIYIHMHIKFMSRAGVGIWALVIFLQNTTDRTVVQWRTKRLERKKRGDTVEQNGFLPWGTLLYGPTILCIMCSIREKTKTIFGVFLGYLSHFDHYNAYIIAKRAADFPGSFFGLYIIIYDLMIMQHSQKLMEKLYNV